MKISAVIFDLDWCIVDNRTIDDQIMNPVYSILDRNRIADADRIKAALETNSLADVALIYSIPQAILQQMHDAYAIIEAPKCIRSFGDENHINSIPCYKILVTSGYRRFQEGKIALLNLTYLFDEIIIDVLDDPSMRRGKEEIFRELLAKRKWLPQAVCVIGDSAASELTTARKLGMITIQMLRPSIEKTGDVDYYVATLSEFVELFELISA